MYNEGMSHGYHAFINFYRVYDIGYEVDLDKAFEILLNKNANKFKLKKHTRDMVLNEAPLAVSLGEAVCSVNGKDFVLGCSGKIWSYGAVSLQFKLGLSEGSTLSEINKLIEDLEEADEVEIMALDKVNEVSEAIKSSVEKLGLSEQVEDYTIIQLVQKSPGTAVEDSLKDEAYRLMEGERERRLSQQTKEAIRQSTFQYSESDLAVVDWNRALLIGDGQDVEELSDILEFAVCQLLELRYYDDLLDQKLTNLYSSLEGHKPTVWQNRYSTLSEEAALVYIEFSEVIDKVGNSLKLVGDTYYAKIFRAAVEKFRLNDWKSTVMQKLNNLAQLSELFSNEINERRNQLMELIIIILIAIEVVPFLYNLF